MADATFRSGPWKGAFRVSEPFVESPDLARLMLDGYLPDPRFGSGFYSRPGVNDLASIASSVVGGTAQLVVSHVTPDGVARNFVAVEGVLYRVTGANLTTFTDVTPKNVSLPTTGRFYAIGYDDGILVNDGVNPPYELTDLGATPVTATVIPYVSGLSTLSRGTVDDTEVAHTAVVGVFAGGVYAQTGAGEAPLPAGTIPASQWGSYRVSTDATGAVTVTAAAANYTTGYATSVAALAAVPAVPTDEYNMGTFVVQASASGFVAGTDALAGGASGNPATTTTYYAGNPDAWVAFGQPVIYAGSAFFIVSSYYDGVASTVETRTTIAWSEPNQPQVGYFQDDFDNQWTLTQTGTDPLFALAPTNDTLYYARAYSWGAIAGTPGVNFASTATHDVVSGNVGCVAPATVHRYLNYVYFADQIGRPWRFVNGGSPEPLWLQSREIFEDNPQTQAQTASDAIALFEPNLNVYLLQSAPSSPGVRYLQCYDGNTGAYMGFWTMGDNGLGGRVQVAGVLRNTNDQRVAVWGQKDTQYRIRRLALVQENVWVDDTPSGPFWRLQTHWFGYDAMTVQTPTRVTALVEVGNAAGVVAGGGTIYTANAATALPSYTPQSIASGVDGIGRYVWEIGNNVQGRGVRVQFTATPTTAQLKLYQLVVEANRSKAGILDR